MSRPATGSLALFGGPPWWLVVAVPVSMILALFIFAVVYAQARFMSEKMARSVQRS